MKGPVPWGTTLVHRFVRRLSTQTRFVTKSEQEVPGTPAFRPQIIEDTPLTAYATSVLKISHPVFAILPGVKLSRDAAFWLITIAATIFFAVITWYVSK